MLKTEFAKLAPLLVFTVLFVFSGCSAAPHIQVKAADPVMNTTIPTTVSSSPTTPVGSVPGIPPVDLSNWKITQDQAIDTACQYIPTSITSQATISAGMEAYGNLKTGEINYYWTVYFENISVTQAELGWQSDSLTTLNPGPDGTFDQIVIRIDAVSGEVVSKTADIAVSLGPAPSSTQVQLEPTDFKAVSSANAQRIPAYLFWAVGALCAVLIAVIILLVVRNRRRP